MRTCFRAHCSRLWPMRTCFRAHCSHLLPMRTCFRAQCKHFWLMRTCFRAHCNHLWLMRTCFRAHCNHLWPIRTCFRAHCSRLWLMRTCSTAHCNHLWLMRTCFRAHCYHLWPIGTCFRLTVVVSGWWEYIYFDFPRKWAHFEKKKCSGESLKSYRTISPVIRLKMDHLCPHYQDPMWEERLNQTERNWYEDADDVMSNFITCTLRLSSVLRLHKWWWDGQYMQLAWWKWGIHINSSQNIFKEMDPLGDLGIDT
jgi:hypothetical protein